MSHSNQVFMDLTFEGRDNEYEIGGSERSVQLEENYDPINLNEEDRSSANFELCIGMEFETEDDAYNYYNSHAREEGFSIRRGPTIRSKVTNDVTSRRFLCSKQGFRSKVEKEGDRPKLYSRPETRDGCMAFLAIKKSVLGKWIIYAFEKEHSHVLVTPSKTHRLRSHRRISPAAMSLIDRFTESGVKPSKIMKVLQEASGGQANLGFINEDCSNHIKRSRKQNNVEGDCYRLLEYFQRKQEEDPGFFWAVEVETDTTLRSIFWADSRCRVAYSQFGDVVIFDTTYKTNKYRMPFAPFTGVNHHKQSILFGCALLADETKESFVWLFKTWLRAMSGSHPAAILTDQDKAMRKAIEEVFPTTRHRFCMWHLKRNAAEQLKHIHKAHPNFNEDYVSCIEGSQTVDQFETSLTRLIEDYDLRENTWLRKMYKHREHWIPCYLRGTFFAGMRTTQRSESMNYFFDGFLTPSLPLNEFVIQYEKALESRRDAEEAEDHNTQYSRPCLLSKSPMELQASRMYTRKIFGEFQKEFIEKDTLLPQKKVHNDGFDKMYEVSGHGSRRYFVTFNPNNLVVKCSCQMFECEGLPCRHMVRILQKKEVQELPPQYFLHRWTMFAKFIPTNFPQGRDKLQLPSTLMVWNLRETGNKVIEAGATSMERYSCVIDGFNKTVESLAALNLMDEATQQSCKELEKERDGDNFMSSQISIRDPARVKPKGRPSNIRFKSGLEQGQKRTRTCSHCGETGHDMRTCKAYQVEYSPIGATSRQGFHDNL